MSTQLSTQLSTPQWTPGARKILLVDNERITSRFREGYNKLRVIDIGTTHGQVLRRSPGYPGKCPTGKRARPCCRLEVGKLADLVVVRGNPLVDLKAAAAVEYVMKNGVTYTLPESWRRSAPRRHWLPGAAPSLPTTSCATSLRPTAKGQRTHTEPRQGGRRRLEGRRLFALADGQGAAMVDNERPGTHTALRARLAAQRRGLGGLRAGLVGNYDRKVLQVCSFSAATSPMNI